MKYFILTIVLMFAAVRVDADIPTQIVEWAETNVLMVYAGAQFGTAWFLEPTLLITACHVTGPLKDVYVSPEGTMRKYPAKVLACNKDDDLALLELTEAIPDSVPTVIAKTNPRAGKTVYSAGYPSALPLIINDGIWQRRASALFGNSYLTLGHALSGSSGGPVLVMKHGEVQVVSVTEAILNVLGLQRENVLFIVAPEKLRKFIDEQT